MEGKCGVYSPGSGFIFLNGFGFYSMLFVTFLKEKSRGREMKQQVQNSLKIKQKSRGSGSLSQVSH